MNNQTTKNDEINRDETKKTNLENKIHSSWLGRESLVQTFDEDLRCNVVEIRTLLDEPQNEENGAKS